MQINEDKILLIERSNQSITIKEYEPRENVTLKKYYDDLVENYNAAKKAYPVKNRYLDRTSENDKVFIDSVMKSYAVFYEKVKSIDPLYVADKNYVADIKSSYSDFITYTPKSLESDFDFCYYSFGHYIKHLRISYLHTITRISIKYKPEIKAYSHRKIGFNQEIFPIDKNFRIDLDTNFGYGNSSYFSLKLFFKDIPIIPYSRVIYHRYANASTYLFSTNEYWLEDESWSKCFKFVVDEVNQFNLHGKSNFIHTHIKESLDELILLFEKILQTNLIYFMDNQRLDSFLDYNHKNVIYDYEHLLNNVNPNAINLKALSQLFEAYDKLGDKSNTSELINNIQLIEKVVSKQILERLTSFDKDRYAYAIAVLIKRRYDDVVFDTDYQQYHFFSDLLSAIIPNHQAIIYNYSEKEILDYRLERLTIILTHIDAIKSLSDIIDTPYYINQFKSYSNTVIEQSKSYLFKVENEIKDKNKQKDGMQLKFNSEYDKIKNLEYFIAFNYYEDIFKRIKECFSAAIITKEGISIDVEKLKQAVLDVKTALHGVIKTTETNFNDVLSVHEQYGNNLDTPWSVGSLRRQYLNYKQQNSDRQQIYYDALIESMNILKQWDIIHLAFEHVSDISSDVDIQNLYSEIVIALSQINESTSKLNTLLGYNKKMIDTLAIFYDHFFVVNSNYVLVRDNYNQLIQPLKRIERELFVIKNELNELIFNKNVIQHSMMDLIAEVKKL